MDNTKTLSKMVRLKENKKKEVELELKKVMEEVEAERAKLSALEKEYDEAVNLFNSRQEEGSLNALDMNSFYDYFLHINRQIDLQKQNYSRKLRELASLRDMLVNTHKEKRLFEILNGKAIKRQIREKRISEQKESDFLSLSKKMREREQ